VRAVKHSNRLPRGAVESQSLEILKIQLDVVLGNQLWLTVL